MEKLIFRFGVLYEIVMDNSSQFISHGFQAIVCDSKADEETCRVNQQNNSNYLEEKARNI